MKKSKDNMVFYINDNNVKMIYNRQCIVFNTYNSQNRYGFADFKRVIQNSPRSKYDNINDVFRLATKCKIKPENRGRITINKNIAY